MAASGERVVGAKGDKRIEVAGKGVITVSVQSGQTEFTFSSRKFAQEFVALAPGQLLQKQLIVTVLQEFEPALVLSLRNQNPTWCCEVANHIANKRHYLPPIPAQMDMSAASPVSDHQTIPFYVKPWFAVGLFFAAILGIVFCACPPAALAIGCGVPDCISGLLVGLLGGFGAGAVFGELLSCCGSTSSSVLPSSPGAGSYGGTGITSLVNPAAYRTSLVAPTLPVVSRQPTPYAPTGGNGSYPPLLVAGLGAGPPAAPLRMDADSPHPFI